MEIERHGADEALRDHIEHVVSVQLDMERMPVGADERGFHDKGKPFRFRAQFFQLFVFFIDAHPELSGTGSTAADLDFKKPKEHFIRVFVFKKLFHFFFGFGGNSDAKHSVLQRVSSVFSRSARHAVEC